MSRTTLAEENMSGQKTVWVTGASSGLGLHTAMQLQKDGWRVIAGPAALKKAKPTACTG